MSGAFTKTRKGNEVKLSTLVEGNEGKCSLVSVSLLER